MSEEKFRTEEFHVNGEELLARIKKLVHEGNIRRIIIKNKDGKTIAGNPDDVRRGRCVDRSAVGCHRRHRRFVNGSHRRGRESGSGIKYHAAPA